MNKLVNFVFFVCLVDFLHCHEFGSSKKGYVFTAPRRLIVGETVNGCLSLHNLKPPVQISLELLSSDNDLLAATILTGTDIETCLPLVIPSTTYIIFAKLRLKLEFENHPEYIVDTQEKVEIEHDSLLTFVETDKPIYKPGQDVNIRILMLKHDLKPWKESIPKVWIQNPSEVMVAQWTNVSTENGMAQLKFPLSPEPSSGTWKVKVQKTTPYPELIETTTFEIEKYVLPKFQISINSPKYILPDMQNITWNICVKYSYGKPVKGTLLLQITPQTPSWKRKPHLPSIRYETEVNKPDGCTEFVLSGTVLGLAHWKVDPDNIVLVAEFTEAGTGVVGTMIRRTEVMHEALKLEYEDYAPKYFKLGLPYHGKLRVLQQDDTPASNKKIQVCLKIHGKIVSVDDVVECRDFLSSIDGFVDFIVPPQYNKNIVLLSFVANAVDYPTKYYSEQYWKVSMHQPSVSITVKPWYSPSNSYITVTRGNQPIVCGEKYSFNVMYTVSSKTSDYISFYYSINSKGSMLIYGHVTHKPSQDTILNYLEFRNLLGSVKPSINKTDEDLVMHRFPLSVKVTPSMAPVSELLLYYVRSDGEIVATTYTIEVGHCFENKIKTAWHTEVQKPGSKTQYHVEAAPWSLCGISVVDKSTTFLAGTKSNLIDATKTFNQLNRFRPTSRNDFFPDWSSNCKSMKMDEMNEEFDHFPRLRRRRRHSRISYERGINYVDATKAFDDFGVIVMTDLIIDTRPCPWIQKQFSQRFNPKFVTSRDHILRAQAIHPLLVNPMLIDSAVAAAAIDPGDMNQLVDQITLVRSYFPETWLWELVPTGKDGKVTIERTLPHTITDWVGYTTCISPTHGLGIAPPTTITAFQMFFLDYSLPYSVKRGELMRLKVSLFNYMNHSLPVRIELKEIEGIDLHLSHPNASFCVKPQESIVHEYSLRPRVIGEVNITVIASIDDGYPELCGPETLIFTRDVIVKPILILPEGYPVEETKSALICPMDFDDDSSFKWELTLPKDVIPNSGRAYLNLIGDILGPALENLDNLIMEPNGCGEQNMIKFVPDMHVIKYLDAIGVNNSALRAQAIQHMKTGYQREQNYRDPDGSYSPFGRKGTSSMWLTAFVLKSFAQAQDLIHIDKPALKESANWIIDKQLENGCFPAMGYIYRKEAKGGVNEYGDSQALTAYVLISLLQSGVSLPPSLINNALRCLDIKKLEGNNGLYTRILTTYALALMEDPRANSSMESLMDVATRHNNLIWWEDKRKVSIALSVEMTAYVILTLVKLGGPDNMITALKAVRWISKQRNTNGGFKSTQDTIVGLEALTKYAIAVTHDDIDLSILITAEELDYVYRLHNDNRMVLTQIRVPVLPTALEISAQGKSCVLVQSNLKYNVPRATGSDAFDLAVEARSVGHGNECALQEISICARYKMSDQESNMALLEVGMISGYAADRVSLNALLDPSKKVRRFEEDKDTVIIYFDKLTGHRTCISFKIIQEYVVDRLEPANVKLYDYYQQEFTVSTNYKIASLCSSAEPFEKQTTQSVKNNAKLQLSDAGTLLTESSFVVVDHELETASGNEGPIPTYVKPDIRYDYKAETISNEAIDLTTMNGIEDQTVSTLLGEELPTIEPFIEINNTTTVTETNIPSPTGANQSCPICMDKLPSDIGKIYCSASSAAKVAIRRLRKVRLLLDLHASREIKRIRGTIEFVMSQNCSCSPLDNPGIFALILNKDNDFLASGDHKQALNDSFHVYGLPLVSGTPCKLAEARASCFNEENIQCTNEEPLVYG